MKKQAIMGGYLSQKRRLEYFQSGETDEDIKRIDRCYTIIILRHDYKDGATVVEKHRLMVSSVMGV